MPRHLVIGDIHGCFRALRALAECVAFRADDVLITLGDYVNRGVNSCAVLDWLIHFDQKHTLVPLRGNHEIMVCGHTPQWSGLPATNGHAICIDTNACRGGWLTCLHVETGQFWQANEQGETRSLHLDEIS